MKKVLVIAVCGLFLCVGCFAQDKTAAPQTAQPGDETRTLIYEYKAELGLTDKQEGDLKKILGDYQNYFAEKNKKLAPLQAELGEMIKRKDDIKKIRKQLEKMSVIQVDANCFDIETSRKVDSILTPEQTAKWNAIQTEFNKKFQERAQARMTEAQAKQKAAEEK